MRRWILGIAVILSLALNVYLVWDDFLYTYNRELALSVHRSMGMEVNKTKWSEGLKIFQTRISKNNKPLLGKKYYYINIWTNWCKPCIKEMPWLDSIAGTLHKDVGYAFVSDISDSLANTCLRGRNYIKNFVYLNGMNDFVSAICNERGIKNKVYPMVLILSNKGEVVYYSTGAYSDRREAADFAYLINKLE